MFLPIQRFYASSGRELKLTFILNFFFLGINFQTKCWPIAKEDVVAKHKNVHNSYLCVVSGNSGNCIGGTGGGGEIVIEICTH